MVVQLAAYDRLHPNSLWRRQANTDTVEKIVTWPVGTLPELYEDTGVVAGQAYSYMLQTVE